ncbi:ABC transporter ATP-binding protein [Kutzneria buriramensis]|uniref:ABC-type multidrug transport system fused ATPase/permease subunit n=1 Tax=Kutzneria buriramensis TaxID=1045776 RepID=A0A3E0GWM8_9PSEU|nr:ABC transporter ATP-binding protein [Kutzneria buriramensis]REH29434.1 ABC-type multidrug transport system fused ATPase/permease subunit [Kutzneria buriramensis]
MSAPTATDWRGVAAEDIEDVDKVVTARLQARSRRLLGSLLRPHKWSVALALVYVLLENGAQLAGPLLVAAAIDRGVAGVVSGQPATLVWCVLGYAVCGLASAAAKCGFVRLSGRIGQDLLLDLRHRVFRHVQRLSISFHETYTSGKIISRLSSDVESIDDLLDMGLDGLLSSLFTVLGIAITLLVLDLRLALVVLFGFVPVIIVARWFRRASHKAYRATTTAVAKVIVQFVETMNGIRAVQAYRRHGRNEEILHEVNVEYRDANNQAMKVMARFTSTVRLVGNVTMAVVLAWGALRVVDGSLQLGVLAAFALYLRRFYDPLDDLAMFANSYSAAVAALEKISGVLEEEPAVAEPAEPKPLPHRGRRGDLRFERVEFRYAADSPIVLPEFDLHVPAGQTIAVVGATGAGKTTLAKLVARFYDPSTGTVSLDGVNLRDVADADLRSAVTMVTQENFLFAGSVADNIAMGRPDATREDVQRVAAAVGAHEFIAALPEGYDTDVRKRGGRLSAGQRQLVAFARALLADPSVLVLDEATSSLDVPTERAVQAALETVLSDRTAVIIAHRLSTVLIADRVLVVDGGRIVEDGSPADLIGQHGRFARLHQAWLDSLA